MSPLPTVQLQRSRDWTLERGQWRVRMVDVGCPHCGQVIERAVPPYAAGPILISCSCGWRALCELVET